MSERNPHFISKLRTKRELIAIYGLIRFLLSLLQPDLIFDLLFRSNHFGVPQRSLRQFCGKASKHSEGGSTKKGNSTLY
ncbi:hypothetical protein FRX31_019007 [Thalictrum thalictroides]|uniref:Uncharacterized protein n=1 Tax=Thalictrum thalictroides TaxID=46969 RepID=A0A7J6W4Z8_THATH|nr:hypothetical protein FRX31_019007 [Thalictrum thalictroides]